MKYEINQSLHVLCEMLIDDGFTMYNGRKLPDLREYYFIKGNTHIAIVKLVHKLTITDVNLPEIFISELESGEVTSSILGI